MSQLILEDRDQRFKDKIQCWIALYQAEGNHELVDTSHIPRKAWIKSTRTDFWEARVIVSSLFLGIVTMVLCIACGAAEYWDFALPATTIAAGVYCGSVISLHVQSFRRFPEKLMSHADIHRELRSMLGTEDGLVLLMDLVNSGTQEDQALLRELHALLS